MSVAPGGAPGVPGALPRLVLRTGKNPLTLGAITFSSEETPEKWNIGAGQQMLQVDDLPGGGRVVNDFGNSADEISFTGRFFGPNVAIRVMQIRAYRVSGEVVTLSWKDEIYRVKIKSFNPGYLAGYNQYEITCVVIQDLNGAFAIQAQANVDAQVQALQSLAQVQQNGVAGIDPNGNTQYGQQLSNLWDGLQNASPLSQNIVAQGPALQNLATEAVLAVQAYQATISPTAPQYPYTVALVASLLAIGANIQSGMTTGAVSIPGGDLFTVAATQYGDVTQAFALAQANGYVYPILPAGVYATLSIPPAQAA